MKLLDSQDSDATNKIKNFAPRCSFLGVSFLAEFIVEEFEPVVAEECKFENGAKKMQFLLEISDCQDTDARNISGQSSNR